MSQKTRERGVVISGINTPFRIYPKELLRMSTKICLQDYFSIVCNGKILVVEKGQGSPKI